MTRRHGMTDERITVIESNVSNPSDSGQESDILEVETEQILSEGGISESDEKIVPKKKTMDISR